MRRRGRMPGEGEVVAMQNWSPKQIVDELDRYIIGQSEAKKAVAVALRNRYRRRQLTPDMREEITPKNIIMIGPTGVGKTEIARRLARLVEAPFVKVEATKFTEVGYVGRDVESIVRDLVEASIRLVKSKQQESVRPMAEAAAEDRLVKLLVPVQRREEKNTAHQSDNPMALLLNIAQNQQKQDPENDLSEEERTQYSSRRDEIRAKLQAGELDESMVEIEVEESPQLGMDMGGMGIDMSMNDALGSLLPKRTKKRKVKVSEARKVLVQQESDKMIDMDDVISQALESAEQDGIIFIDEIDKIAGKGSRNGPDVSREGVQRDILPIVEGSTVTTKYGPVKTDFMLFIAAGAFHVAKVNDLIPELQGRFPITVELSSLTKDDFVSILKQTDNAITKQYSALLSVDNIDLQFSGEALEAIATYAYMDNEISENIGARRLHTVMEILLSDISFNASGDYPPTTVQIDANYVNEHLEAQIHERDLKKFII